MAQPGSPAPVKIEWFDVSLSAPIDNSRSSVRFIGIVEPRNKGKGNVEHYFNLNLGMRIALALQ